MRHRLSGRKFSRPSGARKALIRGLIKSLIQYEQIKTTLPKAKDIRPLVEKIITAGKKADLATRRHIISIIGDVQLTDKIISVLSNRYQSRPGGYTRIIKAGFRYGDAAPMAIIELVDRDLSAKTVMVKESTELQVAN